MQMEALLVVEHVAKRFGGLQAVNDATLDVHQGSITALIGPNGAGKSTLFNIVSGFLRPDVGRIRFAGRSIFRHSPHAIARSGLVRTFQLTRALEGLTVLQNMLVATPQHPGERLLGIARRPIASRRTERVARERAVSLLETFGLAEHAQADAATLSGGQRKLLELGRALMLQPRLLLLDEPLSGINPTLGRRLLQHIEHEREQHGTTVLFVEHDLESVMRHSDRVIVMSEGRVIASGAPELVRRDPRVVTAYLGRAKHAS